MPPALVARLLAARPRSLERVAVAASVLGATSVAGLGLAGSAAAAGVGALASGAVAAGGGAVVVHRGVRGGRVVGFRLLLGLAALVYGTGQLLVAARLFVGDVVFPTPGDVVSTASVPLAVAGLAMLPRRSGEANPGTRLALEAVMLGSASALLLWRVAFRELLWPDLTGDDVMAVVILLADLSVLALLLIAAVRELDRGLLNSLAGMALYVGADLLVMHAVIQPGGAWPWYGAAIACAAWPLIVVGLVQVCEHPPQLLETSAPGAEARRTLVTAATVLTLMLAFMLTFLIDLTLDVVTIGLTVVLLLAYAGGEVVRARQGEQLLIRVRRQALADPLTGLGNRRALTDALAVGGRAPRCVLTLDLDGFKGVNSLLGHAGGDVVLVGVARQLEEVCDVGTASVYRLGGDEFAVVADTDLAGAEQLGSLLVQAVVGVRGRVPAAGAVDLSACVGVAEVTVATGDSDSLAALTASATALRVAKQVGRGEVVAYSPELERQERRRELVEARLRRALRLDELQMHFQPVVDLVSGALMGLEALARWDDEELGSVSPEEFVPLAEQSGLVVELGAFALSQGIKVLASSGAAAAGINLGLNASAIELRSATYVDSVVRVLHEHQVEPRRLVLEVTESLFLAADDPAIRTLQALSDLGVGVAIDDFGTGYSSLAYLHRLPVQVLKVDRTLTAELHEPRIRAVMGAIVDLGLALGLDVVIEGVETQEMADIARSLGARIGQGWLFSRAVPAVEVRGLLARTFGVVSDPVAETVAG